MAADDHLGPQFSDFRWESAYNNSAEELFPDAFNPATGRAVRDLTSDEDDRVIKHATQSLRAS